MLAVDYNNAREAEIDCGREEGGRDGETNEVDEEVVACRVEGVLVQQDSSNVAYNLTREAEE